MPATPSKIEPAMTSREASELSGRGGRLSASASRCRIAPSSPAGRSPENIMRSGSRAHPVYRYADDRAVRLTDTSWESEEANLSRATALGRSTVIQA
jgi:hypothetical protein